MVDVVDFVGEHMNKHQVKWKVLEAPVDVYYCGLGVAKNSTGLKDWLNVAIFEMHRRGKTDELWKKWFGIDMMQARPGQPVFLSRRVAPCAAAASRGPPSRVDDGLHPPVRTGLAVPATPDQRAILARLQIAVLAFCGGLLIGTAGATVKHVRRQHGRGAPSAAMSSSSRTPRSSCRSISSISRFPTRASCSRRTRPFSSGMTLNAGAYLTDIQRAGFELRRTVRDGGRRGAGLQPPAADPLRDPPSRSAGAVSRRSPTSSS